MNPQLTVAQVFESLPDAVVCVDREARIVVVNAQAERLFGYRRNELLGQPLAILIPESERDRHAQYHERYYRQPVARPMGVGLNLRARRKDGSVFPVDISLSPLYTDHGLIVVAAIRDITEHQRIQKELREREEWNRLLLSNIQDVVYLVAAQGDPLRDGQVLAVHGPTRAITGYPPEAFLQDPELWYRLIHPDDLPEVRARTEQIMARMTPGTRVYRVRNAETGQYHWLEDRVIPRIDARSGIWALFGVARDITERKQFEHQLLHQARHDSLTDLPNRRWFMEQLEMAIQGAQRAQAGIAVLFLDLDGFKLVNDSLGHSAGDDLLREVSCRLRRQLRPCDRLARLGGDEFAVLVEGIRDPHDASTIAQRLLDTLTDPIVIRDHEVTISASIGITVWISSQQRALPEELIQQADLAMYQAKSEGKGRYTFFHPSLKDIVSDRLEIEHDLRNALRNGELHLYYQPEIDLATGTLVAVEALLRWIHPTRGLVTPDMFIGLAEETGLILPIGRWVLEQACRWARQLPPALSDLVVSVNVSARQFHQPSFAETVSDVLSITGIEPDRLRLEVTETIAMKDRYHCAIILHQLRDIGVKLAMDDFGTGYSSLSYLRHFPFDTIKLDRSFIHELERDRPTTAIVRAVVAAAHELGLTVVAEGIETRQQLMAAYAVHCDSGQGYLFGRPVPPEEFLQQTARFGVPDDAHQGGHHRAT